MGKSILDTVITLLNDGGVPAAPAQPEEKMLIIHTPVAAVSIEKVDTALGSVTVMVEVVAPIKSGGKRCQKRALEVCRILREAGAECVQGNCTFHSRPALFRVPVTAVFYGTALAEDWIPRQAPYQVTLGNAVLLNLISFSAEQKVDEEYSDLDDAPWQFTLEEYFPTGTEEQEDPRAPFGVYIAKGDKEEVFTGCKMTSRQRTITPEGIHQIRKGRASGWAIE